MHRWHKPEFQKGKGGTIIVSGFQSGDSQYSLSQSQYWEGDSKKLKYLGMWYSYFPLISVSIYFKNYIWKKSAHPFQKEAAHKYVIL